MKRITLLTICGLLTYAVSAQEPATDQKADQKIEKKYCVSVSDGKTTVSESGNALTADVVLQVGATLTSSGNIIWKDGSKTQLRNGECVDETGATYAAVKTEPKKDSSGMTTSADDEK